MLVPALLHALLVFVIPLGAYEVYKRSKEAAFLNPVILCYLLGMILGNLPGIRFERSTAESLATVTVILAIPFMLLSANMRSWFRLAKVTTLGAASSFGATLFSSWFCLRFFKDQLPEYPKIAGMLAATYIGSMPNLIAVGSALNTSPETLLKVQAADLLVGGAFLFILLSFLPALFAGFLKPFTAASLTVTPQKNSELPASLPAFLAWPIVILLVALGALARYFTPAHSQDLAAILTISTLALLASAHAKIHAIRRTFITGEYLFLSFCVAIGTMIHRDGLMENSGVIFLVTGLVITLTVVLHLLICRVLKIDRDTCIMTLTAGIFSPAMVGPVATVLKNPEMVVSGITAGLVGLGLGSYLGIALAELMMQ